MGKIADVPTDYAPGWIATLDGRTAIAQDMAARFAEVCADLGGADSLSYMQRSLIERGLWLEYWLGRQERELADGKAFDVGKWVQAANGLQGIWSKLGLSRRARNVTPTLHDYLKKGAAVA